MRGGQESWSLDVSIYLWGERDAGRPSGSYWAVLFQFTFYLSCETVDITKSSWCFERYVWE